MPVVRACIPTGSSAPVQPSCALVGCHLWMSLLEGVTVTGYVGADPDRLDALAQQLLTHAQQLEELRSRLSSQLLDAGWIGQDADDARAEWESHHAQMIGRSLSILHDMSHALSVNAG